MFQDLKYALRVLRGNPAVTLPALIALALGIGANTAIFSLVDAVVLRPLPYPQPDRLMVVDTLEAKSGHGMKSSWPAFQDWREQNRTFEHLAAYSSGSANLTGLAEPVRLETVRVTPEFFPAIGVAPAVGNGFDESGQAVVIAHGLWLRQFGGDSGAIGRRFLLDGRPFTLAGVLPEDFHFPLSNFMDEPQVYVPLEPNPRRGWYYLSCIGRLKPGIAQAQAKADLDAISRTGDNDGNGAQIRTLHQSLTWGAGDTLRLFGWAVALVLTIACANVSNLLMSQAARRHREMAMRKALGATRARLLRQLLTESVVLSLAGGALGTLLALWGIPLLAAAAPAHTAFSNRIDATGISVNGPVLGFTFAVSLIAGLVFGTLPAWQGVRYSQLGRAARGHRVRGLLVMAEVALSLVLLTGAGLLIKSFARLLAVDPGFRTEHLLTVDVELPELEYAGVAKRAAFVGQALDRLRQAPGVSAAAAVNAMPMTKVSARNSFEVPGENLRGSAGSRAVSPGYFEAMGIPLVRGRLLTPADVGGVGVINRAMADRYWPNQDPLGKVVRTYRFEHVRTPGGVATEAMPEQFRIVGVVGNVRHLSLAYTPDPEMFIPYSQMATTNVTFLLRSPLDTAALTAAARNAIWSVDGNQPLAAVRTMDQLISQDLKGRRFVLLLLAVFTVVALTLAAAGIFGVVLHSVSQRTREIGIRLALGASPAHVVAAVGRETLVWIALGLALGTAGAIAGSRLLASYLYAVPSHDPGVLAITVTAMAALGVTAALLPARAAAKVDPAVTLRGE